MAKIRDKLISLRVDEDVYDAVKKRAETADRRFLILCLKSLKICWKGIKIPRS